MWQQEGRKAGRKRQEGEVATTKRGERKGEERWKAEVRKQAADSMQRLL